MTTPTGPLAWSQARAYDAVDDRAVITALARGRLGLIEPIVVEAGAGLALHVRGGWLGVASCDDRTSAVVGDRVDNVVQANPGPGTGQPRQDVLWLDTFPDEGYWEMRVITLAQAANRTGIPLAAILVPVNANLASQMDITPADASLDRRLMAQGSYNFQGGGWSANTWGNAANGGDWVAAPDVVMLPGQWYRVRATWAALQWVSGSASARVGVGWRLAGQPASAAVNGRARAVNTVGVTGRPVGAEVDWVFRYPKTEPRTTRTFSTRAWIAGGGQMYIGINEQPHMQISVEDIGS